MGDPEKVTPALASAVQKLKKRKPYKNPVFYNFTCECGKNFSLEKNLKTHKRKFHNEPKVVNNLQNKQCSLCDFSAKFRDEMIKHFEVVHNIPFIKEKHTFATQGEFLLWKSKIESETVSKFVNKGTKTFLKHKMTIFNCHRTGNYVTRGKGLRALKKQGSNKINGFCPARMVHKYLDDGTCIVDFSGTHIGHQNELKYLTITRTEKEELAKKISLKIPFDDILDEIGDSIYDCSLQRMHLLTRKDLYNIETSYNLHSKAVRRKDDAMSVESWVKEMEREDNCVLFYKPQGIYLENFSNLKSEDFVLIIMTEAQLDILKRYGNDCVCLDGTHGLNSYDFELNTLLVLDELREGFPCAFLISNRSDTQVLALFFEKIRDRLEQPLKPKVFMSDLPNTFFNAWVSIMSIPEKRLYCTWHVDESWRKNLNKIKSKDTQVVIYKHLRTLLTERDPNAFHKMLEEFGCIEDLECTAFIEYFQQYYAGNYEYWAYCYRLHCGINTNIHLERMHRSIKYIYLKGKNVKRFDKGIGAIMRFIRDKLINRVIVNYKGKISTKIVNIRSRHKTMEKMDLTKLITSDEGWEVLSKNLQEMYLVQKQETNCQDCQLVCLDCGICIHQFLCSCLDSAIHYNMCKHIHLVATSIKDTHISRNKETEEEISNCLVKAEPENDDNYCESAIWELIENKPCQDVIKRKEKLKNALLETLDAISSIEEIEVMEKMFVQVGPSLAAIRD